MLETFKPRTFGKYYLIDRIAVGGMAELYKAKQYGIGGFEKMLVIKKILPHLSEDKEFVDMFIDEAKITVSLSHSNLGQVYELGQIEKAYFIAMEYIEGKNLREISKKCVSKGVKLSIEQIVYIISEICKGIDYAHRKKSEDLGESLHIIHRDISPQNVLISYEGEVKVVDFGIAKAAGKITKTQAGVLKGKFGYMSPEQARGEDLDSRSDIFSVGIIMWELVTGKRLFLGETDFDTLEKVKECKIDLPSKFNKNVTPLLDKIMLKVLEPDREKRYQTAGEFQLDLTKYLYSTAADFAATKLTNFMKTLFSAEIRKEQNHVAGLAALKPMENLLGEGAGKHNGGSIIAQGPGTEILARSNSASVQPEGFPQNQEGHESFFTYNDEAPSPSVVSRSNYRVPPPALESSHEPFYQSISYISDDPHGSSKKRSFGLFSLLFAPFRRLLQIKTLMLLLGLGVFAVGVHNFLGKKESAEDREKNRYGSAEKMAQIKKSQKGVESLNAVPLNQGYISIKTEPAGASVQIQNSKGELVKVDPGAFGSLALKIGHYRIKAEMEGYNPSEKEFDVKRGRNTLEEIYPLEIILEKAITETTLYVSSSPPGAQIFLNDQSTGLQTPATLEHMELAKTYSIKLAKDEYKEYEKEMVIENKNGERMMALLDKLYGKFLVKSIPEGADVFVDGKKAGKTPTEISDIKVGKAYRIKVSLASNKEYYPFEVVEKIQSTIFPKKIEAKLKAKPPEYGIISFQASPWAYIYINGVNTEETTYSELKLKTGTYEIELVHPNFPKIRKTVTVKKNKTLKITADMATKSIMVR